MLRFCVLVFILAVSGLKIYSQDSLSNLYNMSLEELLDLSVKVKVSSSEGDVVFKTPSTTAIFTRKQIEQYGFQTLPELIDVLGGVSVSRSYLKQNIPTVRGVLQDHYANKVLILINGKPQWNAVTGESSLDLLSVKDVERVELLKGPASVLYGTNAYTGTINIVTRRYDDYSGEVRMSYGTGNSLSIGGNAGHSEGDFSIFLALNSLNTEGVETTFVDESGVEGSFNDFIKTNSVFLDVNYKSHTLQFMSYSIDESFLGVIPNYNYGAGNIHYIDGWYGTYTFDKKLNDKLFITSNLIFDLTERNLSRSLDNNIRANIKGKRLSGELKTGYRFSPALSVEGGMTIESRKSYEYKNYDVRADTLMSIYWEEVDTLLDGNNGMKNQYLMEHSCFGQLKYAKNRYTLLGGVRFTSNDVFGNDVSSRFSAVYSINDKNSVKAMYGESFRAPSLFETNFFYKTVLGNNELVPEKSRTVELAYLTSFKSLFLQFTGYRSFYMNKIFRSSDTVLINQNSVNVNRYNNGNTFGAWGTEAELKYVSRNYRGFINYAFVAGDDGDKIEALDHYNYKYVPKHTVSSGVAYTNGKLAVSPVLNYRSKTGGIREDVQEQLYVDVNSSYSHKIERMRLVHHISVKNVLNEQIGYPEFSRLKSINTIPSNNARMVIYSLKFQF